MGAAEVRAVADHYRRRVSMAASYSLASIRHTWQASATADFDASWASMRGRVTAAVVAGQTVAAGLGAEYAAEATAAAYPHARRVEYQPRIAAWAGVTGSGQSVAGALSGTPVVAKQTIQAGGTVADALAATESWLLGVAGTVIADTHRGVEQVGMAGHGVGWYVRAISGDKTCGRCVILAGRRYRMQQAFERHPRCHCIHIPAPESLADDLTTNPGVYLAGLSDGDLARTLGSRANAEAWRDGADVNQLINAYRRRGDVRKAQLYGGRTYSYTIEGITRRGRAYAAMHNLHGAVRRQDDVRRGSDRYFGTQVQRLMPSSIYEIAKDKADAIRLLKTYGWIL